MKRIFTTLVALAVLLTVAGPAFAKKDEPKEEAKKEDKGPLNAGTFAGLTLRSIGPALTSGRIGDLAVHPDDPKIYYVAVSSGGVWKTVNAGTTFSPIFDGQGSYSIGCVTIDPNHPHVVWVGTGENNSQRSVGYGDGVYKSVDGGMSWKKMGLENSEHIGKIVVDPRDSNTVYVAAQGPLWNAGGDRGLYKTVDGGESWEKVLEIDEHTGVSDLVMDPRDPDVLYAASYQRRRRVWTLINGGPGSAIHKSTDGGESWSKLSSGLPGGDVGRIGLALAPSKPDTVYAIIEAAGEAGGFYRSVDAGGSWQKRSGYVSGSPQYYQEIVVDPHDADRIYSNDTFIHVSEDGGGSFRMLGEPNKHVDNHALWIDPDDTDHILAGCDGGIYETWDRGATWRYASNLPVTQFYKISTDNDAPFYNVYGGTQDNYSLGGPSRTDSASGIVNSDWFVTLGGDGYETQVDPTDPDILYAQLQYGNLVRFDRSSGEAIDIQPQPEEGEALRWNWDSPLQISHHSHTRLYFGGNKLFRTDDRGNSWRALGGDLTRQLDRNTLEVMGRVWPIDAVAKNASTSFYGTLVAFSESPLDENVLYTGSDDGLVQVTEDGGATWRREESFPGVPEMTYVNRLEASFHDRDTVYAAFNGHKNGDFAPHILKSTDLGQSWTSIAGDLPERGSVYSIAEDPVNPDLLFAGTEFGVYFTLDGGKKWVELSGGMPTVAVRDLEIQRRENDLVVGTFGRGIYVLDDFTPLRGLAEADLEQPAMLFTPRRAWMYNQRTPLGGSGAGYQGSSFFTAPNPPFGATFTYYLEEAPKSLEDERKEREKELVEAEEPVTYPTWEELEAEQREPDPLLVLTVRDADGEVVRRLTTSPSAGVKRISWDLRLPDAGPIRLEPWSSPWGGSGPVGPLAVPGEYTVSMAQRVRGETTELAGPVSFTAEPLGTASLPAADRGALLAFQQKVARLQRAGLGVGNATGEIDERRSYLVKAVEQTPAADLALLDRLAAIEGRLYELNVTMWGDPVPRSANEPSAPGLMGRIFRIVSGLWDSTSAPTMTQQRNYDIAANEFAPVLDELRGLVAEIEAIEDELEEAGAPWTPGRVPTWQPE